MLTPSFDVSQDDDFIKITIRAPYVKILEAEVYYEGNEFKFYCKPYFLHLHLPGQLSGQSHEKASYNVDTGTVVVELPKSNHGEHFANLEMLTTLLPKKSTTTDLKRVGCKPLIEMVGDEGVGLGAGEEEEEEFDWHVEQNFPTEADKGEESSSGLVPYGFALQHQGVFLKLQEEIPNIVDCPDPDHMTPHERRVARIAHEEVTFENCQDHYLADLMENEYITVLLAFEPPWTTELTKWRQRSSPATKCVSVEEPGSDVVPFTASQRDQLKNLPNKDYTLDKGTRRSLYLGLVGIIYAYAYDFRCTEGEGNVESAWTICKLSPTLSWLEEFHGGVYEVVFCCLRRALCYPLYRHWKLALCVLQDIRDLFRLGRRKLLQCILSIRETLNGYEPYYILNNLYITDYAIWLQKASVKQIQSLADELDEVKVEAGSMGWHLVELELGALEAREQEPPNPSHKTLNQAAKEATDTVQNIAGRLSDLTLQEKSSIDVQAHKVQKERTSVTESASATDSESDSGTEITSSTDSTGSESEISSGTVNGNETAITKQQ